MFGMHGAAYGYVLLLPSTSATIELFPKGFSANWHMEYLAKWNKVKYFNWKNSDSKLENKAQKKTTIPLSTAISLITNAQNHVCHT